MTNALLKGDGHEDRGAVGSKGVGDDKEAMGTAPNLLGAMMQEVGLFSPFSLLRLAVALAPGGLRTANGLLPAPARANF